MKIDLPNTTVSKIQKKLVHIARRAAPSPSVAS